jgi:hypothetical protein
MQTRNQNYKVDVPEGEIGRFRIERFEVTDADAKFSALRGRGLSPGVYTRLMCGSTLVMSDTPAEIRDHRGIIRQARGKVLIHGLGIGMVLQACLEKPEVEHVTVVELEQDVIDLVAPHYKEKYKDRLDVLQGDAFTWKPEKGRRWDCAWHDVWDYICPDNLPEMAKLHRRFGRRVDWQGSWCKELCKRYRDG